MALFKDQVADRGVWLVPTDTCRFDTGPPRDFGTQMHPMAPIDSVNNYTQMGKFDPIKLSTCHKMRHSRLLCSYPPKPIPFLAFLPRPYLTLPTYLNLCIFVTFRPTLQNTFILATPDRRTHNPPPGACHDTIALLKHI